MPLCVVVMLVCIMTLAVPNCVATLQTCKSLAARSIPQTGRVVLHNTVRGILVRPHTIVQCQLCTRKGRIPYTRRICSTVVSTEG